MIVRLIVLAAVCTATAFGQEYTVKDIMRESRDWIGVEPVPIGWTMDGSALLFSWNPVGSERDTVWAFRIGEQHPFIASDSLRDQQVKTIDNILDFSSILRWEDAELRILNVESGTEIVIVSTGKRLRNFVRSGDSIVTFFDGTSLWSWQDGVLREAYVFTTDKKQDKPDSLELYSDEEDKRWLQMQQEALFEHVRQDVDLLAYNHGVRNRTTKESGPISLHVQSIPDQAWLATDGSFVLFRSYKDTPGERAWVADFVTRSGHTEKLTSLPKSVSERGSYQTNVYVPKTDSIVVIDGSSLPDFDMVPAYEQEYRKQDSTYEFSERIADVFTIEFGPDGTAVAMALRSRDDNHRWIASLDPSNGALVCLDHQYDSAWIDGPEIGWYGGTIGWTQDGQSVWYVSESSGHAQLYATHVVSNETTQLTHVDGMIHTVQYHNGMWFGTASGEHPGVLNAFIVNENNEFSWLSHHVNGAIRRLRVSPNNSHVAYQYSTTTEPWNLFVAGVEELDSVRQPVVQAYNREFLSKEIYTPEVRTIKNEQHQDVWVRLFAPEPSAMNGKGVVFVHGAGYLQNAHTWWSNYFREFFFHQLLRDQGFYVIDVDYRGSKGYGRDWRGSVYRHMGGADLADIEAAGKFLVDSLGVNASKVGVYGGSYGGFITLMAMFQEKPVFAAGAALRSVTDWAHYHPWYTRPRLNSPQKDSLAYYRSSPINFAENLKGSLLMCHGMVDVNVQYSDIVRLTQRLVELEKDGWELAVYPVEGHAFKTPSSWRDEYQRILNLFRDM